MSETFHGYIETTQDVLLVFEGCRRGLLSKVCRRLQEKERKMIRSGSVFVFDERDSGIKRWTDGLVWSPSRILGNFLIYRELDKRVPGDKKLSLSGESRQRSFSADQSGMIVASGMSNDRNRERRLVGSLSDSYRFRKDGLIKKTMSITINGVAQHLISYYMPHDIISNKLRTPSSVPELASLEISPELLVKQNFRIPPMVEPPFDQAEAGLTDDRRIHPFRSMSLGSLRSSNQYQQSMLGRNASNSSQLMYTSSVGQTKMNLDNGMDKNMSSVNLSTDYGNQNLPFYSNTASGFAPLPSPSSMTSSPNTPMLSPVRHSFSQPHQARHYSMPVASTGSSSIPRYGYRNSFDMMSIQNDRPQIGPVHPHMIPEVNVYYNEARIKSENDHDHESINQKQQQQQQSQQQSGFTSSPNIGQLLNPVHPLNKNPNPLQTGSDNNTLFQSMGIPDNTNSAYPNYSSMNNRSSFEGKLPSIPDDGMLRNSTNTTGGGGGSGYGGYDSFYNQRQQPLANTHSVSDSIIPMFRNGIVHPSMYDEIQTYGNDRPELGMEPLMLK